MTGYKPSKRVLAVAFGFFLACALAMLGYQVRLSRLLPEHTSEAFYLKSIKMFHERSDMDAQSKDDDLGVTQALALAIAVEPAIPANRFLTPDFVSTIQLNLSPHSGYRRPPPAC